MVIESRNNLVYLTTSCLVVPEITSNLPNFHIIIKNLNLPSNIQLADPTFHVPAQIDLLIGAGHFWDIIQPNQIICGPNLPKLQKNTFGWILLV